MLVDIFLKGAVLIFIFAALLSEIPLIYRRSELINLKKTGESTKIFQGSGSLKTHFKNSFKEVAGLISRRNSGIWLSFLLLNGAIGVLIAYYPDYSRDIYQKPSLEVQLRACMYVL